MRRTLSTSLRAVSLVLAALFLLCSCGKGGGDSGGDARFRVLNASTGYTSIDVYSNNQNKDDDDAQRFTAVSYGTLSDYASLPAATYALEFRRAGASTALFTVASEAMAEDSNAT